MKILAIHYDDDCRPASHARVLRSIVEQQAASGHRATVFASQRVVSSRWRLLRAVSLAWFMLRAFMHAAVNQYDLILASNRPGIMMGLLLRTIRSLRGTPYIYICHDLHPELAFVEGELKHGRHYNRLLRWDAATCTAAQRTVVPSHDMAATLAERGVPTEQISVVHGFALTSPSQCSNVPAPLDGPADTARFLFVGELERRHGLERLIAAARLVAARVPFQLIFMGDGNAKSELVELAGDLVGRRIVFVPPQSAETVAAAMRACDYGIVSFAADAHRYLYSHECSWFGLAGCPVMALVEPQCELAQTIERHDLGCVVASRSVTGMAEAIIKAVVERSDWNAERRMQLATCCRTLFGHAAAQHAWNEIIADAPPHIIVMPHGGRASKAA